MAKKNGKKAKVKDKPSMKTYSRITASEAMNVMKDAGLNEIIFDGYIRCFHEEDRCEIKLGLSSSREDAITPKVQFAVLAALGVNLSTMTVCKDDD